MRRAKKPNEGCSKEDRYKHEVTEDQELSKKEQQWGCRHFQEPKNIGGNLTDETKNCSPLRMQHREWTPWAKMLARFTFPGTRDYQISNRGGTNRISQQSQEKIKNPVKQIAAITRKDQELA